MRRARTTAIAVGLAAGCLVAPGGAARAAELVSQTTPYPGITYAVYLEASIPATAHVVAVDLTSDEIQLRATTEEERGQTTSDYAASIDYQVAVNGDFFSPLDFLPAGLARGGAKSWPSASDDALSGFFSFHRAVGGVVAGFTPPGNVVTTLGDEVAGAVGGRPMLIESGIRIQAPACDDLVAMPCQRAPRTAVAVSADGDTLWLVVVDGWQEGSLGMGAEELAAFLEGDLGAHQALMLDGGSSSTLYIEGEGGVVSSPSDGVERQVANQIAVRHGAEPSGTIQGVVREGDPSGPDVLGATVRLDDGREILHDQSLWSFDVVPRWTCVTGSAPGYQPKTECRHVWPEEEVWASLFLQPGDAPPDAGASPDAGAIPVPDGGGAGNGGPERSGCGCRAGGGEGGALGSFALLLVIAWRRSR